jgi:tRNA A-37 threonylcarbamoyl transferase component Bud32
MISNRTQVYKLVQDLHGVGVVHGDLEPRNVVRARGGGFRLIDFSASRKHACKEIKVQYVITSFS